MFISASFIKDKIWKQLLLVATMWVGGIEEIIPGDLIHSTVNIDNKKCIIMIKLPKRLELNFLTTNKK